jgi:hypothetical protein
MKTQSIPMWIQEGKKKIGKCQKDFVVWFLATRVDVGL